MSQRASCARQSPGLAQDNLLGFFHAQMEPSTAKRGSGLPNSCPVWIMTRRSVPTKSLCLLTTRHHVKLQQVTSSFCLRCKTEKNNLNPILYPSVGITKTIVYNHFLNSIINVYYFHSLLFHKTNRNPVSRGAALRNLAIARQKG